MSYITKDDVERHLEQARNMIRRVPAMADDFLSELTQLEKEYREDEGSPEMWQPHLERFQDFQLKVVTEAAKYADQDGKLYDDKGKLVAEYKFRDKE